MLQMLFMIDMSTGSLNYFSPATGLRKVNESAKLVLEKQGDQTSTKTRKLHTIFIDTALVNAHLNVGAKIGTVHLQKNDRKLAKLTPKSQSILTSKT